MAKIKYTPSSIYHVTPVRNNFLDLYIPPIEPNFDQTTDYVIDQKYNRRPDLLAYDLYNDAKYWWIFALYNRDILKDPLFDFVTGLTIVIPSNLTTIGR